MKIALVQMKKALIAKSGGVDSSLAAKLTKEAGFDCIGCTMKLYNNEDIGIDRGHTCCSLDDVEDARIECRDGEYILKKAVDESKDQSYVLYSMTQKQLAHTLFPLGNMRKTDVFR